MATASPVDVLGARHDYLLRLGDDALVLGQRLGEWCGHGPVLEVDISLANLALDYVGQAMLLLGEAGDGDQLAFHRDVLDFRTVCWSSSRTAISRRPSPGICFTRPGSICCCSGSRSRRISS